MKNILIFIFCILFSFFSFSQKKDALVGVWLEEEGQSKIEIYAVNTSEGIKYEGKIIWLEEPLRENGEIKLDDKRQGEEYNLHIGQCIYCRLCEEVCPVDAIVLTQQFEFTGDTKADLVYNKEQLKNVPWYKGLDPLARLQYTRVRCGAVVELPD